MLKRHPILAGVLSVLFIALPQWANAVWGLFSKEPMIPTIAGWLGTKSVPSFPLEWITVPIGLLLLAVIIYQQRRLGVTALSQPLRTGRYRARDAVDVSERQLQLTVRFGSINWTEDGERGLLVRFDGLRITNHSKAQGVSLDFEATVGAAASGVVLRQGRTVLAPEAAAGYLTTPLDIGPQQSRRGSIGFVLHPAFLMAIGGSNVIEQNDLMLHVEDHVSQEHVDISVLRPH